MTIRMRPDIDEWVEAQARARGVSFNAVVNEHVERARMASLPGPGSTGFLAKVIAADRLRQGPRVLPFRSRP